MNLTEEEYQRVCEACDELLNSRSSGVARISVAWLHPIRLHPTFSLKYQSLFKPWGIFILGLIPLLFKSLLQLGIFFFKSLAIPRPLDVETKKVDCLIISHLTNASQLAKENNDSYCGEVVAALQRAKITSRTLFIDHIKATKYTGKKTSAMHNFVPAPIGFYDALWVIKTQVLELYRVTHLLLTVNSTLKKKAILRTAIECLSSSTRFNLVLAVTIKNYLVHTSIKAIVTTFEGHSWERVVYHVVKKYDKKILCCGYQHAFIFYNQHGALRKLRHENDPDYILASGEISRKRLFQNGDWNEKEILLIGRSIGNYDEVQINISRDKVCLVIPEGIESECEILFRYSLNCAKAFPDVEFIWRLHPIINFSDLKKKYPFLSNLPENINLSQMDLATDASRARWVLYRGSMAVIESCIKGAGPIFLKKFDSDFMFDPLEDLVDQRAVVSTEADLGLVFKTNFPSKNDLENMGKYCRKIFTSFNGNPLIDQFGVDAQK